MSTKLPWTRLFADKWAMVVDYLPAVEGNIYMRLRLRMLRTGEPLSYNLKVLSHYTGYSVKKFEAALNVLLEEGYLIRLEDGRLWNLDVEEELNNSNENLDKSSEKASKAAKARWDKNKDKSDHDARAMHEQCTCNARAMHEQCMEMHNNININNNNNINNKINNNKKNKNIILSKKEIEFENLETTDLLEKPSECDDVQSKEIKMIEKLPSRKVGKVGKQLSEIVEKMMPAYFPEKASFFEETKKTREKQEVESMLEDFKPDLQYAIEQGLTRDEALSEFKKFIRFSKANPCRNAHERDWQKAWYKWITHPEYGLVMKKHAESEIKELCTIFSEPLTETLAKYISNTEPISSFAT
ncbi:DUF1376 domain-containing protein [Bartonella jaculi]|uniref:Phage related protein n=1 Tax=Bartonella jaculi TaxID=686226 RepID=A0ABP9NCU6_9HYPH